MWALERFTAAKAFYDGTKLEFYNEMVETWVPMAKPSTAMFVGDDYDQPIIRLKTKMYTVDWLGLATRIDITAPAINSLGVLLQMFGWAVAYMTTEDEIIATRGNWRLCFEFRNHRAWLNIHRIVVPMQRVKKRVSGEVALEGRLHQKDTHYYLDDRMTRAIANVLALQK